MLHALLLFAILGSLPTDRGAQETPQRIRVGGDVQKLQLTNSVAPEYPPLARQARIEGVVRLSVDQPGRQGP